MTTVKRILLCLILTGLLADNSEADVITLKNGRRIEGAVVRETKDSVVMDIGIGETTLNRNDVRSIEKDKSNNAAIHYLRAASLASYGSGTDGKNMIAKFEKTGFRAGKLELEQMLGNNKECYAEIKKALTINECDFYFEDKYNYSGQSKKKDNQRDIMYLHSIILLQGRYYEEAKDFDKAVDAYLSALTFARQISQGPDPDFKSAGIIVQKNTYPIIEEYLKSENAVPGLRRRIFEYLDGYEKGLFSCTEFLEESRSDFIRPFNSFAADVARWSRENPKLDANETAAATKFADELLKQANELAGRYYGNFIKASGTDKDEDWEFAVNEYEGLIKETKPPAVEDEISLSMFVHKTLGDPGEYSKKDPKMTAVTILNARLPQDKMMATLCRGNGKKLKAIELLAAKKMKAD